MEEFCPTLGVNGKGLIRSEVQPVEAQSWGEAPMSSQIKRMHSIFRSTVRMTHPIFQAISELLSPSMRQRAICWRVESSSESSSS